MTRIFDVAIKIVSSFIVDKLKLESSRLFRVKANIYQLSVMSAF